MREALTISTYLAFPSNAWIVSAIVQSQLVSFTYMGGSKREAIREFKRYLKTL